MVIKLYTFLSICIAWKCIIVASQIPTLTIHGGWSPWSKVKSECVRLNATEHVVKTGIKCGGGVQLLDRSCTNPTPQGLRPKGCAGKSKKTFACAPEPCNITWSEWAKCIMHDSSQDCGRGTRRAISLCSIDPEPGAIMLPCQDQRFPDKDYEYIQNCNTWNKVNCTSPCKDKYCPDFSICVDQSTDEDPFAECQCQYGRIREPRTGTCIFPASPPPTRRPIPTLEVKVKDATTIATKSASTVLIVFVMITLIIFASLRIFDVARVIQMNMEISIVLAHGCLIFPSEPDNIEACRIISILTHYFFTSCFIFMLLESVHVYSLVAFVVSRNGLMTRIQNMIVGWGIPAALVIFCVAFNYDDYGGKYHCWLDTDSSLFYVQIVPLAILVIFIFTMIEAAGSADYVELPEHKDRSRFDIAADRKQLTSAKIMQRTNLVIMPLVFASYIVGVYAEYEQSVALYGTFTILNGVTGAAILVMHCSGNERVRDKLQNLYKQLIKKE